MLRQAPENNIQGTPEGWRCVCHAEGTDIQWYIPRCVVNAGCSSLSLRKGTCQYPVVQSINVNTGTSPYSRQRIGLCRSSSAR